MLTLWEGHRVVRWIARELDAGRHLGWDGKVLSGYRTNDEQIAAAGRYAAQLGKPLSEVYPNGVLASNHCRQAWPGGAVDVTNPELLYHVLEARLFKPERHLVWAGPTIHDYAHFSSNGH